MNGDGSKKLRTLNCSLGEETAALDSSDYPEVRVRGEPASGYTMFYCRWKPSTYVFNFHGQGSKRFKRP